MTTTAPRLWTRDGFSANEWQRAEEGAPLAKSGKLILSLGTYLALAPAIRESEAARIGVELLPGDALDELVPHLGRLPLIALAFPAYNDGRSYSKAELLRTRHGYQGEIRATGDVLIDQIAHMLRCGFSSLEVTNATALKRLEAERPGGIPFYYQPAAASAAKTGKYAWRRVSA